MEQPVASLNLPNYVLQQIHRLGYFNIKDINLADEKLNNCLLQTDWTQITKKPKTENALSLYEEETVTGNILTFIKKLDEILGNGVPLKQITEFCGEPGSGKSQISYQLCINVQLPFWCGGISGESVYFCTKYGFTLERIKNVAIKTIKNYETLKLSCSSNVLHDFDQYFNIDNILKKISIMQIDNDSQLVAAINILEKWVQENKNIRLVVIDSITAPIRFAAVEERAEILNKLLHDIRILAQKYNFAVVLTNEMTTKISSGREVYEAPSFGSSYYHKINTRVLLTKTSEDVFTAAIIKSATRPCKEVTFRLPY